MAFLYPVYLLIVFFVVKTFAGTAFAIASLFALPLLAKSYVLWK
jgi:hypothetical protein